MAGTAPARRTGTAAEGQHIGQCLFRGWPAHGSQRCALRPFVPTSSSTLGPENQPTADISLHALEYLPVWGAPVPGLLGAGWAPAARVSERRRPRCGLDPPSSGGTFSGAPFSGAHSPAPTLPHEAGSKVEFQRGPGRMYSTCAQARKPSAGGATWLAPVAAQPGCRPSGYRPREYTVHGRYLDNYVILPTNLGTYIGTYLLSQYLPTNMSLAVTHRRSTSLRPPLSSLRTRQNQLLSGYLDGQSQRTRKQMPCEWQLYIASLNHAAEDRGLESEKGAGAHLGPASKRLVGDPDGRVSTCADSPRRLLIDKTAQGRVRPQGLSWPDQHASWASCMRFAEPSISLFSENPRKLSRLGPLCSIGPRPYLRRSRLVEGACVARGAHGQQE